MYNNWLVKLCSEEPRELEPVTEIVSATPRFEGQLTLYDMHF